MDIYTKKSRWKVILGGLGALIVLFSLLYTSRLTNRLAEEERNKVKWFVMAQQEISEEVQPYCMDCQNCLNFNIHNEIVRSNTTIPVILVGENGEIQDALNLGDDRNVWARELTTMKSSGVSPVEGTFYKIYYRESTILRQLRFFPVVQLMIIAAFITLGYIGFSSARRAEQNRVWVGMAKETAHQLGTPISAIMAWIDELKRINEENNGEHGYILDELNKDVNRLNLIADRFSKIGSSPVLKRVNIYEELHQCRTYMEKRAPKKVSFHFPAPDEGLTAVSINPPLFDWVVENLLRNALDAMDGKGEIAAQITEDANNVNILITDTGKGIPPSKIKTVFKPGFTTKPRGWGLGLSLARRIIEDYHKGHIFVKWSEEGKGTTFCIQLPKNQSL
jgi:signal transduction histidine kinase